MPAMLKKSRLKVSGVAAGAVVSALLCATASVPSAWAQASPSVAGTVKSTGANEFTVTDAAGKDVSVTLADSTKLLQTPPGSKDLKSATEVTASSIVAGDKVLISGSAGDSATALHARRVVVMRASDIAQNHAAEEEAWQHGGGGLVKSVDATAKSIVISSGAKMMTVTTTPSTKISQYAGSSVKFQDAVGSTFEAIKPGDQLRVRGAKNADGSSIQADAIVAGYFKNFSGLLTAIDAAAGTVTLKDLATKKVVTVKVLTSSDVRRLPAQAAARFASRATGAAVGPAGTEPASTAAAASGAGGSERAGMDLSQMLARLPTETLGSLKVGDAVMIVASQPSPDSTQTTAVTVLAGVEPILQAEPKGEMTLTPWSVGSGGAENGG